MNKPMDSNGYLLSGCFIPPEILTIILGYVLPHKSIIQCRIVCKIWKKIIEKESWRFVVKLKENQPEPYTDAEVEKISKLPWFMLHFMCAENSLFGQNFVKTKINADRYVWKLLNPDSPDWQIVTDDEHASSPQNELSDGKNSFAYEWKVDDYDYRRPEIEERIIEFPKCGLSSLILREFRPKITVSFWICNDDLEFSIPVSMLYHIKLSLKNSARKESGEDICKVNYTGGVDGRSTWNKVTLEAQVTESNSDLHSAIISHKLHPEGGVHTFTRFLIRVGKPNILAVDFNDIVKHYQEEKNESFATVLSADYPLYMRREINLQGTFSQNLLPDILYHKGQLAFFRFPESGILEPGIWYGRAFPDICIVENLAGLQNFENADKSMGYENEGKYFLLYELSCQIFLKDYGLFGFLMDEFQPRIEACVYRPPFPGKNLRSPPTPDWHLRFLHDAMEMKYEMMVSLLDNEGKILHQKQGSEILRIENSKKLLLTFENYGKGVTYIKYSVRRHMSMNSRSTDYNSVYFLHHVCTVIEQSNVRVLLPWLMHT